MNVLFKMMSKWLLAKAYPLVQSGIGKIFAGTKKADKELGKPKAKKAKSTRAKSKEDAAHHSTSSHSHTPAGGESKPRRKPRSTKAH